MLNQPGSSGVETELKRAEPVSSVGVTAWSILSLLLLEVLVNSALHLSCPASFSQCCCL